MLYEVLVAVGLAIGFGAGCLVRYKSIQIRFEKKLAGVKAEAESAKALFEKKLAEIAVETQAIEAQADRRIVPAIHAVTARIKRLL